MSGPATRPVRARLPQIAVVGRPNVGKSTLVNRIIGRREAIVEERPGVTRDRKSLEGEWAGRPFALIDTGGWMAGGDSLDGQVSAQAERAMGDADLVLFVVDATVGSTADDEKIAARLRRGSSPVLVVANKVDSASREPDIWEFARLGLGDPWPLSALHGRGSGDLLDAVVARLPAAARARTRTRGRGAVLGRRRRPTPGPASTRGWTRTARHATHARRVRTARRRGHGRGGPGAAAEAGQRVSAVAIVGRPNVGKSTLFNRLLGEERSIVHDRPGTTRDTIDTVVETDSGPIRFLDTAGMRRKSRVDDGPEYFSFVRALQAIDGADAALLVIDATAGVTHQDQRLAERIDAAGSPIVIVLNKWDLVAPTARDGVLIDVADRLAFLAYAPVLKTSAITGFGAHRLLPALRQAIDAYHRRVPTRELNTLIQSAQASHPSPGGRVLYATQGATDPPTFTLFTTKTLAPTYLRYLERRIREHFGFGPTPLKLRVRRRTA